MAISDPISRREAMQRVTVLLGGVALIDGESVLAAMADAASAAAQETTAAQGVGTFTAADVAFLDEIAETILPETNTPGAKAARTGAFMALMVTDAYTPRHQQIFRDGMRQIEEACQREYGASFIQARPEQRLALLQRLDAERQAEMDALDALRRSRAPVAPPLTARRAGSLFPLDEGAGAARLLHLGDRLPAGDAVHGDARTLRSLRAVQARREDLGLSRLSDAS